MNMDQTNKDPIARERDSNQWLELALGDYSKAEPRAGLENRILARLQAERSRRASQRSWWWAIATAVAFASIIAVVWVAESGRVRNPGSKAEMATAHGEEFQPTIRHGTTSQVAPLAGGYTAREVAKRNPASRLTRNATGSTPKLAQFPSRRNMSKGELLLARCLNEESNKEALLKSISSRDEVDLSIGSLEIRSIQIPDIEISEDETNY
jgi:hypothetical protein